MNRNVMKYYHPQAHSFDTVPTNGEVGNQSPIDLVALDSSHPSAVSSTNSPRSNRTLRPKRTEPSLDHVGAFENPPEMTQDTPRSPAVGRGRGWENQPSAIRRGRGRAATQGEIISIPDSIRDKSLAETRLKPARHDTDEPPDITEEIIAEDEYTASPNKRGKFSCDQCYNCKTKVHRSLESSKLLVLQEDRRQVSERTVSVRLLHPDSNNMQYPFGEWKETRIVDCRHGKRLQALQIWRHSE
jgi:hypothetical protein